VQPEEVLRSPVHLVHQFLAHIAATQFGFDTAPVAELVHWADIVDGAQYESPEAAVEMAAPAMKLTLIIESTQDPAFIPKLIPLLTEMPLAEVLSQPFVANLLPPLLERHKEAIALIRSRAEERDGTIFFDITDHPLEGFNKFIPYYLYPNATYSIGLSKSSFRTKVAVGRIRGPRPTPPRWLTWPRCASATAAAATRVWEPSAFRPTRPTRRARPRRRLWRNSGRTSHSGKSSAAIALRPTP